MTSFVFGTRNNFNPVFMLLAALLAAVLLATPLHAEITPTNGSGPSGATGVLDIHGPLVVQPCGNIPFYGGFHNASNFSEDFNSTELNITYNSTVNASFQLNGSFSGLNITAPCETNANGSLDNLTIVTNSSNSVNKTAKFFVSNATNVTITLLEQKPPFALSSNNTVNVTYKNGSVALPNNRPTVKMYNSKGQITTDVQAYNYTALTDATGTIQYNLSISSTAAGTYTMVVDYGLARFTFGIQSAYKVSFFPQTTTGETRGSFAPSTTINLVAKSRYANGTAYNLGSSGYLSAYVTVPNGTTVITNLSALNTTTSPGVLNKTFSDTSAAGNYVVRISGFIQGIEYETGGKFDIRTGLAKLEAGSDFFQQGARQRVILPGSTVRFKVLLYNNSDDSVIAGGNCSSIVLNSFTNLVTGANTSWTGSPSTGSINYDGSTSVCTLTVGMPNTEGTFRVNATLLDPANYSRTINAEGIISVRTYGVNFHICPAVSDFMPCGFTPFFEKNSNASFQFSLENYTSGSDLARSNFNGSGIASISVRKLSFTTGTSGENTNWTENTSYYLQYPQTNTNAVRLILDLPNDNATGPHTVEVVFNTSVGLIKARDFFMVKGTSVDAFGGPASSGGFNPQISCNGTFTFQINAFDLKTGQQAQGVKMQGVLSATHVMTGTPLDATALLNTTTNTTDSNGQATFNVTFNTSKTFKQGPYDMRLNISYQGAEDEAFAGFMCGSGGFDLFKPEGFEGDHGPGGQGGPGGSGGFGGGVSGNHEGYPPLAGPLAPVNLSYVNVGFGGQGNEYGGGQGDFGGFSIQEGPGGPGPSPGAPGGNFGSNFNGTLKITSMKYFNRGSGNQRSVSANGTLTVNVTGGRASLSLQPSNFSLSAWPQGFMELEVNLTNGSAPGIESGPSATGKLPGFESAPFQVFVDFGQVPSSIAAGTNVSMIYNLSTNLSLSGNNFTIRLRSMNGMGTQSATLVSTQMLGDFWNQSSDEQSFPPGAEQWNVTFTVPAMDSGPVIIVATINNSQGVSNDFEVFTKISSLEVQPMITEGMIMSAFCNNILDDADQNGSMQSCISIQAFNPNGPGGPGGPPTLYPVFDSRMNLSVLNVTYNVSSKSGNVCYKDALNWTNFFNFDPGSNYGGQTSLSNISFVAIFDNTTPGVFDTIVLNGTGENLTIITSDNTTSLHRNLRRLNESYAGIYALAPESCGMVNMINGTSTRQSSYNFVHLGRFPRNQNWLVPYRVIRGNAGLQNASVDVLGFGNMTLGFGGFENMLTSSQYSTVSGRTDNNGVAFVRANVSVAGEFMVFWKANATIGGTFTQLFAKLQRDEFSFGGGAGNQVQIAAFNAFCNQFDTFSIQSVNQNVTVNCTATYFNNTAISGANFTLKAQDFSTFPPTLTTLTLFNTTANTNSSILTADSRGQVSIKFTNPVNWTQGRFYDILGTVTDGVDTQLLWAGGLGFYGGGQGGFGGPQQFDGGGQGGP